LVVVQVVVVVALLLLEVDFQVVQVEVLQELSQLVQQHNLVNQVFQVQQDLEITEHPLILLVEQLVEQVVEQVQLDLPHQQQLVVVVREHLQYHGYQVQLEQVVYLQVVVQVGEIPVRQHNQELEEVEKILICLDTPHQPLKKMEQIIQVGVEQEQELVLDQVEVVL
tara:strand:- start:30 stop:530 length:501 start_codon:yes stop_codon:yes gene_type:complete